MNVDFEKLNTTQTPTLVLRHPHRTPFGQVILPFNISLEANWGSISKLEFEASQYDAAKELQHYRNGVPLFHSGGVIGGYPTKKQDEILMLGKKNELVLTEKQQDGVSNAIKLLEWNNTLASKMRGLFSGGGLVPSTMSDAIKGTPLSPAAEAIVNNNSSRFAPQIRFEVQLNGVVTNDVYEHLKPDMEQMVNQGLKDVFSHRA